MKKILATGGHAGTTALAVIRELKKRDNKIDVSWIGVKKAIGGSDIGTIEYKFFPKYGIKFYPIEAGKIQTKLTSNTLSYILKIPFSFLKAFLTAVKIKPDVVISFGGSISVPVVMYAWLFKKPSIVHEQTSVSGRANLIAAKFASKIAVSRISSRNYFDESKTIHTGNPLTPELVNYANKLKPRNEVKKILITGGSRGSLWINNAVHPIVYDLASKYKIYWQVGEISLSKINIKNRNITVFGQKDPKEMAEIIADSDICISRAGANTVSELIALKKPSVLIPIPWVYLNEQFENAKYMQSFGLARILEQKNLNPQNLLLEINKLIKDYKSIVNTSKKIISPDLSAGKKMVDLIMSEIYNDKNK